MYETKYRFIICKSILKSGLCIHFGYNQRDATNALKHFLIGQFVKFFLLIGPSNVSKHLSQDFRHSLCQGAVMRGRILRLQIWAVSSSFWYQKETWERPYRFFPVTIEIPYTTGNTSIFKLRTTCLHYTIDEIVS